MIEIVLLALSLGASNFGASIGIGLLGVDQRTRLRVALIFGSFELVMPVIGLAIGHGVSSTGGDLAARSGGVVLMALGAYSVAGELRPKPDTTATATELDVTGHTMRLVAAGFALSIDNLVVGFALGTRTTQVALTAITIATVSVGLSLIGLEFGARLGPIVGQRSELAAGIVLIAVGAALAVGAL